MNAEGQFKADVVVTNGIITEVALPGKAASVPLGAKVIDATGQFVMPGGIDPHTHLAMPFMGQVTIDDFYSGHRAALAGGTTMHIDFALPTDGSMIKGYEAWQEKAKLAVMDYGFHMAVTEYNDKVAGAIDIT